MALESFPDKLLNYRRIMGWTQEQLGKQWNYSHDTISSWERGIRIPGSQQIPRIAKLLGIAPEELVQCIKTNHDKSHDKRLSIMSNTATIDEETKEALKLQKTLEAWGDIDNIYLNRTRFNRAVSYTRLLDEAQDVLVVGISLNAITMSYSREEIIDSVVDRKCTYTLCFLNPDSPMCAEREREEGYAEGQLAGLIRFNMSNIENICKDITKRNPDCSEHLRVMTYDLLPRFNIYIFDDKLMTVESYGYGRGEDTPTFVLKRQQEGGMFAYYASIAHHILEHSEPKK